MSTPIDLAAVRVEMEKKRRAREEERARLAAEEDAKMEAEIRELGRLEAARLEEEKKAEERKKEEEARVAREEAERVEREKREKEEAETIVHRPRPVVMVPRRSPVKPAPGEFRRCLFFSLVPLTRLQGGPSEGLSTVGATTAATRRRETSRAEGGTKGLVFALVLLRRLRRRIRGKGRRSRLRRRSNTRGMRDVSCASRGMWKSVSSTGRYRRSGRRTGPRGLGGKRPPMALCVRPAHQSIKDARYRQRRNTGLRYLSERGESTMRSRTRRSPSLWGELKESQRYLRRNV